MSAPIEDYALIGDCHSGALVSRHGSIDWLCLPRFDSHACFAALLGTVEHGCWVIRPDCEIRRIERRYRHGTLVLETDFETDRGAVRLVDFMPLRTGAPHLVRQVVGLGGRVPMKLELVIRFCNGSHVPWVQHQDHGITAIAGPDALHVYGDVDTHGEDFHTVAEFEVGEGDDRAFVLAWYPSHEQPPPRIDPRRALRDTELWWREWSAKCTYEGPWHDEVLRSLITLKALTYQPTGGICAALTTSLPEEIGGERNWDYRYCWLRDATFTLYALMTSGYIDEACAWRDWMIRAVAGKPTQVHTVYGLGGERWLNEHEVPWLPGYGNSRPVRIGNAAHDQLQLDVFGEIMDAMHNARKRGLPVSDHAWRIQRAMLDHLEWIWTEPDESIWEVRDERQHFVYSKVLVWVAFDRAVKAVERHGLDGPVDHWRRLRQTVHDQICRDGYDAKRNTFVQAYGVDALDASLLIIPLVGFLPPSDPRVHGTIRAIEEDLLRDGFVLRYETETGVDGLSGGEATFLLCSFWLADNLAMTGRREEARELFDRLLAVRNDVGLLAEEYDHQSGRMLGNFPQAFSHVALINTAANLSEEHAPDERADGDGLSGSPEPR